MNKRSKCCRAFECVCLLVVSGVVTGMVYGAAETTAPQMPKSAAARAAIAKRDEVVAKAREAYLKVANDADRAEMAELAKPLAAATKAGDLAEANAIDNVRKEARERIEDGTVVSIANIVGAKWRFEGGSSFVRYNRDGSVTCNTWSGTGKWTAVSDHAIIQAEPEGKRVLITFTADRQAAIWQYSDAHRRTSEVHYSTRDDSAK